MHARFSRKTYRVRLYSTTRWRKIFISYRFNFFGWGLPAGQTFDRGRDPPGWNAKSPFSIHAYQVCPYLTTRGRYRGIYMHFMTILSNYDPSRYSGPWEPQTCIYRRNSFCIWKRRLQSLKWISVYVFWTIKKKFIWLGGCFLFQKFEKFR